MFHKIESVELFNLSCVKSEMSLLAEFEGVVPTEGRVVSLRGCSPKRKKNCARSLGERCSRSIPEPFDTWRQAATVRINSASGIPSAPPTTAGATARSPRSAAEWEGGAFKPPMLRYGGASRGEL